MAQQAVAADRLTPVLVALTGYYVVAGFASLTNVAVSVPIMGLAYSAPIVVAALAWVGMGRAMARRRSVRPLPV